MIGPSVSVAVRAAELAMRKIIARPIGTQLQE